MDALGWKLSLLAACCLLPGTVAAQVIIPGSGQRIDAVGDTFEDEGWSYIYNLPKSSDENDKQKRFPTGGSTNGRWFEGVMRGQPDVIKRVPTPDGGIAGSQGSLLMVSRQTGVPGRYSYTMQQDDFIVNVSNRLRGAIPVSRSPSVVVRVYLPPWEEWEQRTGPSFGFRAACLTHTMKKSKSTGLFGGGRSKLETETYWPGMFIQFNKGSGEQRPDSAVLIVRGGRSGHDFRGPVINEPGWWTLGMSFTPDGSVHYFAHAGVEDLDSASHISSTFPYSYRCEHVDAFFFNVCSGDNGQWSTPWIIDDPALYYSGRYATQ